MNSRRKLSQSVFTVRSLFGRYIVARLNLALWRIEAWSGSGWVAAGSGAHILNFGSHQEAERYARSFGFAVTDRIVQQGGAR
jgi:hypothetical protein